MRLNLLFFIFCLLLAEVASGQILRYRLSVNSGMVLGEPGQAEIDHPMKEQASYSGSKDFEPGFKAGVEFEMMAPVTADFELGLQLGYNQFSGHTPKAPLFNFFLSRHNPLPNSYKYPDEALIYDTELLNTLATARWYFLPYNDELNIFMKLFGGVAFVGTDFTFHDPVYRVKYDVGVLYSRGTQNSEFPKVAGFNGGVGLGATYRLSDKIDLCFETTVSAVRSDIVNGVPNFNYVETGEEISMQRTNALTTMAQASIGIIYSAVPDRRLNKRNFTRSRRSNKNLFWKRKNSRPYSKRKR